MIIILIWTPTSTWWAHHREETGRFQISDFDFDFLIYELPVIVRVYMMYELPVIVRLYNKWFTSSQLPRTSNGRARICWYSLTNTNAICLTPREMGKKRSKANMAEANRKRNPVNTAKTNAEKKCETIRGVRSAAVGDGGDVWHEVGVGTYRVVRLCVDVTAHAYE